MGITLAPQAGMLTDHDPDIATGVRSNIPVVPKSVRKARKLSRSARFKACRVPLNILPNFLKSFIGPTDKNPSQTSRQPLAERQSYISNTHRLPFLQRS